MVGCHSCGNRQDQRRPADCSHLESVADTAAAAVVVAIVVAVVAAHSMPAVHPPQHTAFEHTVAVGRCALPTASVDLIDTFLPWPCLVHENPTPADRHSKVYSQMSPKDWSPIGKIKI